MLCLLSAIALFVLAPVRAELTEFDTKFDYLTTAVRTDLFALKQLVDELANHNLTITLLPPLDATEVEIAGGNLTFPRHFARLRTFSSVADEVLGVQTSHELTAQYLKDVESFNAADKVCIAPLAFGDVAFDVLETMAKTIGTSADNCAKQNRAERKAYEALADAGASVHRLAAQFNDCFERLRREDRDVYNGFHTLLVQLEIETKRAYGY